MITFNDTNTHTHTHFLSLSLSLALPPPPPFSFSLSLDRIPLTEESASCRTACLTAHNTHKRQTGIHARGEIEPAVRTSEQLQTHALDRAAIQRRVMLGA